MRAFVSLAILLGLAVGVNAAEPRGAKPKAEGKPSQKAASSSKSKKKVVRKPWEIWFLSHQEFSRLKPAEQKIYLREVKKVLATLPEKSPYFADKATPSKRTPASTSAQKASPIAYTIGYIDEAEKWKTQFPPTLLDYTEESRQEEYMKSWRSSMWWTVFARLSLDTQVPKDDPKRPEVEARVEEMEDFFIGARKVAETSIGKNGELKQAYDTLRKARAKEIDQNTPNLIPPHEVIDFESKQSLADRHSDKLKASTTQSTETETPVVSSSPLSDRFGSAEAKPVEETPFANSASAQRLSEMAEASVRGYRCMYSGFVIKKDPCRGPQSIPDDMGLDFLDKDRLTCEDGQVLCNPLLFGLNLDCELGRNFPKEQELTCLKSGAPLCVSRGKYATRECNKASDSDQHLEVATALIRQSPQAWNEYIRTFYELCDEMKIVLNDFTDIRNGEPRPIPESTRKDVEQTCANARKKLEAISDLYRQEAANAGVTLKPLKQDSGTSGQQ